MERRARVSSILFISASSFFLRHRQSRSFFLFFLDFQSTFNEPFYCCSHPLTTLSMVRRCVRERASEENAAKEIGASEASKKGAFFRFCAYADCAGYTTLLLLLIWIFRMPFAVFFSFLSAQHTMCTLLSRSHTISEYC